VRQMFAKPLPGVDEKTAIKRKRNRLIYNFEHCTFDEEPYTGVFFAISQDEKYEIRLKAVEALKYFSSRYASVQDKAQNILMNMLNDEIDDVRISALKCMSAFDKTLILDRNSVNVVIFNLKEHNSELRLSIYSFFGHIKVDNWETCKLLMDHLLQNIKKFKQDKYSILKTFKRLGENHDVIVYNNLDEILRQRLKYHFNEPQWDNEEHTAKMITVCSSIMKNEKILEKVPWYFEKQWSYYCDKYPELVTHLPRKNRVNASLQVPAKNSSLADRLSMSSGSLLPLFTSKLMTESTLINKYRVKKYHDLMLLLKRIKDNIAIPYDFESLMSNPHHYDDSFLE